MYNVKFSIILKNAIDYRKILFKIGITHNKIGNSNIMEDENGISSIKMQGFN